MAVNPTEPNRMKLTEEEAQLMIRAIEEVEREEANQQERQRSQQALNDEQSQTQAKREAA